MSTSFDGGAGNWNPAVEPHSVWKRRRVLEAQRYRRSRMRRVDYYPSDQAGEIIDGLRTRSVGGDASSIIDRIVCEWAAHSGISPPVRAPAHARRSGI